MRSTDCVALSCALAFAVSGCATAIKGTTQRIAVVTIPVGAQCTLRNERAPAPAIVAATPGEAEVRRDSAPLDMRCTKEGHLDVAASYPAAYGDRGEDAQRRQIVIAEVLLRQYNLKQTPQAGAIDDAEAQHRQMTGAAAAAGVATVALPVTVLATAAPTLGGGAAIAGAGILAAPLFLGVLIALPIAVVVDLATGAAFSYPAVVSLILPAATFADESSRDTYFADVDRDISLASQALQADTKADCFFLSCERRGKQDEAFIAEWRAQVAGTRARTNIAGATAADSAQARE